MSAALPIPARAEAYFFAVAAPAVFAAAALSFLGFLASLVFFI